MIKIRFVIAFDLFRCIKQIKTQRLFLTRAPFPELPSNIGTMESMIKAIVLWVQSQIFGSDPPEEKKICSGSDCIPLQLLSKCL